MPAPGPQPAPVHPQESRRVAALGRLGLLDRRSDDRLEALVEATARALGCPAAFVAVAGAGEQVVQAVHGTDGAVSARGLAVCAWAVGAGATVVVADAAADARFSGARDDETGWQSFVAAPLVHGGLPLGALAVADARPREPAPEDVALLERLADLVVERLTAAPPSPRAPESAAVRRVRAAVAAGQVDARYAPVVDLADRSLHGVQAVLGWRDGGAALPDLEPAAGDEDLLAAVDRALLVQACSQVQAWRSAYPAALDLRLSVDVRARHAGRGTLLDAVGEALDRSGLPPEVLTLDVSEGLLLHDGRATADALRDLQARGTGVALGRFGQGRATLEHLRELPVTRLGVPGDFVAGLGGDGPEAVLVEAVVGLAARLGLDVVADGVEDESRAAALAAAGCAYGRGPLFGRPRDAAGTEETLHAGSASVAQSLDVWAELLRRRRGDG